MGTLTLTRPVLLSTVAGDAVCHDRPGYMNNGTTGLSARYALVRTLCIIA